MHTFSIPTSRFLWKKSRLFLLLALVMLGIACNSTKLNRPAENYNDLEEAKNSTVNIPVRLSIRELERSLNQQLGDVLYEEDSMKEADGMYVRAEKLEDIRIKVDTQTLHYIVPIKLLVKKDIGFTTVGADGEIELNFKTNFNIEDNWTITTLTEIETYTWRKRPKLKFAGISLPAKMIGDIVIDRSKEILTKSIDEQIKNNLDLRQYVQQAWDQLQESVLISPEYNTWITMNPALIQMTPIVAQGDSLESSIVVEARPEVSLGKQPDSKRPTPLPKFAYADKINQSFELHLSTDIPYSEAEKIAKAELVGETFSQSGRSVVIEDIDLYGQGNKIVVVTKLSGSYNGEVYLMGKPVYKKRKNAIDLEDLKFSLETKNFLFRTAGWLLKSNIKKKIQENMDFILDANMEEVKKQIQEQLKNYELAPNVFLKGNLKDLSIQDAYLTPMSMRVDIAMQGNLAVEMKEEILKN